MIQQSLKNAFTLPNIHLALRQNLEKKKLKSCAGKIKKTFKK